MNTTKKSSTSIQELGKVSRRLNELTDEANKTIRLIEKTLSEELQIGTTALVRISGDDDFSRYLVFGRYKNSFRIKVDISASDTHETIEEKAWSDCGRDLKLEALNVLPELLEILLKELETRVSAAETALNAVSRLIDLKPEAKNSPPINRLLKSGIKEV